MTRFTLSFIGLLFLSEAFAQTEQAKILFEHIAIPGAIRSTQVNDLAIDKHGLIWIASEGLIQFDGYKFRTFKQASPTQDITGNEIICLLSDKTADKLYLGTHSFGIIEYTYATNAFRIIPTKGGVPIIGMLTQTEDGEIWAGSFSNGLFHIENDSLKKVNDPYKRFRLLSNLLPLGNSLLADGKKTIFKLRGGKVIDTIAVQYPNVEFSINTRLTAMTADRHGKIWLGMERGGVLVYDTLKKDFVKYFSPDNAPFYHRINKIFEAKNGNIWILTKANGLAIYNPSSDSFIHLTKDPLEESSLSGTNCTSIVQDKTGIIWIGSTGDLNKYDQSKIKFQHIYHNPYSTFSLNDNMVRGVYEDKNEKLWVGTDGGVIHIIDRKKETLEKIPLVLPGVSQPIVPVYFLELDDNIMLVGSSTGLLQLDRKTKKISYFKPFEKIKNRQVRQLVKDRNTLYFIHTGSLLVYDLKTRKTKVFPTFSKESIVNATAIYLDSKARLWVGVRDGLALYNPENDTFKYFEFESNPNRPVGTYFMILSMFEHQGKLWVGTFNSGLWTLDLNDLENPKITSISKNKGLPDNTVYATVPDQEGNLWMSTNHGISKHDIKNNLFLNFGLSDGLQHEEFNRLSFFKCKNGEILFGGINGLNYFDPKDITVVEENYKPILAGFSISESQSNQIQYRGLLGQTATTLKSNENNLDFHFFVPNYRTPRRFDVYYQLVGFDPDWLKTESNILHYTNLLPGEYKLRLKTISVNGIETVLSFPVSIKYPFWQTWYFIIVAIAILLLLIYLIIQLNVKKAKEDKIQLEKLLRLRTQEIEKSREELANLNQKKDVIFSILSHDLRSPLTTLKGFLSILIDDDEMLSKADIKRHASSIRNSVTSSLDLIDNTLFWSLSQTGNITYTPERFQLKVLFDKIDKLYLLTAEKKQIKFTVDCDETVVLFADENMVYVTLRNLVSNALKFTPEGKSIHIMVTKNHQAAEIRIKDQGIGMSELYIDKLLKEEHLQVKMGTSNEKGTGLGIILCKKFIHMNNGELQVKSTEGEGSEFIVKLPLAQA